MIKHDYWKGKKRPPFSEEWKRNMSLARKRDGIVPPNQKGKKKSVEMRRKLSIARSGVPRPEIRGANHYRWLGGRTTFVMLIRLSPQAREWRIGVFTRDSYTCQECGVVGGALEADHIIPFSALLSFYKIKSREDAENCPGLWDISNGRTLCVPCHKETDTYMWKARQYPQSRVLSLLSKS